MKNSKEFYIEGQRISIGDPYVLRHNGKYYLYFSTPGNEIGIHCFSSKNLIDYEYCGIVTKDLVTKNAYAPEVLYAYNQFYLVTSPGGNGHYVFVSKSPLGPFKRITKNIGNMIDGSFVLDTQNQLYMSRANHQGIAMVCIDEKGHPSRRVNLKANMNGWTEGPSILNRFGKYYLTYCGNHLISRGYRVYYSVSDMIDKGYEESIFNPLLIQTQDEYNSLGHSSTVLAPDLDGYYLCYHQLFLLEDERHIRNMGIDRLHFNGKYMVCNASHFEIPNPKMPDFYEQLEDSQMQFIKTKDALLSKIWTKNKYTAEFNFTGIQVQLLFGNECYLAFEEGFIVYYQGKSEIARIKTAFDFHHFRTIRLVNDTVLYIYLDGVYLGNVLATSAGPIGYRNIENAYLGFTAFTNHAVGSSDKEYPLNLPGVGFASHSLEALPLQHNDYEDMNYALLTKGMSYQVKTRAYQDGRYVLSILSLSGDEAQVLVNGKEISFINQNIEYGVSYAYLSEIDLKAEDAINITVLSGEMQFYALKFEKMPEGKEILDNFKRNNSLLFPIELSNRSLLLEPVYQKQYCLEFQYEDFVPGQYFAIIFNASGYSNFPGQPEEGFLGYCVGFRNDLLVLDKCRYGLERMYDRPVSIEIGKNYELKVVFDNSKISVYLNSAFVFETFDNNAMFCGLSGVYLKPNSKVLLYKK